MMADEPKEITLQIERVDNGFIVRIFTYVDSHREIIGTRVFESIITMVKFLTEYYREE